MPVCMCMIQLNNTMKQKYPKPIWPFTSILLRRLLRLRSVKSHAFDFFLKTSPSLYSSLMRGPSFRNDSQCNKVFVQYGNINHYVLPFTKIIYLWLNQFTRAMQPYYRKVFDSLCRFTKMQPFEFKKLHTFSYSKKRQKVFDKSGANKWLKDCSWKGIASSLMS